MRIPLSWIESFSPLPPLRVEEISRRFTLASCEVEGILACVDQNLPELWSQVQLVEIRHLEKHPNAQRLWLADITTGSAEIRLVCGAFNLYCGMKTLWAPEGTRMRSGYDGQHFVLQNKEIMGVLSCGMLCSERELGISDDHEGIIDLSELDGTVGLSFAEILARRLQPGEPLRLHERSISGIEFILEVENKSLTHRPDLWGICGIAREFGAVFPQLSVTDPIPYGPSAFRVPAAEILPGVEGSPITLEIEPNSSCLSYCALSMEGVQVTESPQWLQRRLRLAGVSVINSIVDISNYVMLELGIPNHIFDRDKLSGDKIRVYRLKGAQSFQTLDEQQRQLLPGDTVVADKCGPQVIAGIMGGQNSSISESTQRILLEVAVWDSHAIHESSMRLGLRTDSSLRYEKSLDPYSIERSLWRLCQLIREIHPRAVICGHLESYYQTPESPLCIETSAAQLARVLDYPLDNPRGQKLVCQIFRNLGFRAEESGGKECGGNIRVQLPSYRTSKDLSLEEDLVEEVGRIIGYDNIVPRAPLAVVRPVTLGGSQQLAREIRNFLVLNGRAQEVLSYPLIGAKLLEQAHWPQAGLRLANPLNPEQDRLRPSLIPSHLELVGRNAHNNRLRQFRLFELGRSYHSESARPLKPREQKHLLISSYDEKNNPLLELRNLCERLLCYLGCCDDFWEDSWKDFWEIEGRALWPQFIPAGWDGVHPRERLCWQPNSPPPATLTEAWVFSVHPALLREWKLKGKLAMACIPLGPVTLPKDEDPVFRRRPVQFRPPHRFPSVEFDCTVMVPPQVMAAKAIETLKQKVRQSYPRMANLLQKILVRSVYPVSEGRWLTLQCVFADRNGTLQSEEIKQLEDQIVAILQDAGFPLKNV